MIEVQKIADKGRGIIATEDISKGKLLEIAPVGIFPAEQRMIIDKTDVFAYYFIRPKEYAKNKKVKGYIVFGLASLCNHAEEPNCYIDWVENEVGLWSKLIAKKHIKKGEEATLFYTNINEYPDEDQFV